MKSISIVIPVWNEEQNIKPLVERLDQVLFNAKIRYELIFIDDHSTDKTAYLINIYKRSYPITYALKRGRRGKAQSLAEGFSHAKHDVLVMIDADLQYPPEAIPHMVEKLEKGAHIVVANRKQKNVSLVRKCISYSFKTIFGKLLFNLSHDVQAGLKVFTKEVWNTIAFTPTAGWAFDLEFLHRAREAGFIIENADIVFYKRSHGKSKIGFLRTSFEIGLNALQVRLKKIEPQHFQEEKATDMRGAGVRFKRKKFTTHTTLHHSQSAIRTTITSQKIFIFFLLLLAILGLVIKPILSLIVFIGILSFIYFIDVFFNFILIVTSLKYPKEIISSDEELVGMHEKKLPMYSILCPLYKEAHVIPHFLKSIAKLDYPKEKLDVMLLLEEDDKETIAAVKDMRLPHFVRTVIVPHSMPKTKPKACNYGLSLAKGDYLVVYDAEDMPDPLQLKKAYLAFQKVDKNVICLQGKLNYYNPHQNLLTRFFTAEYSLWFDVMLTGLQSLNTALPLGGTSNHFKTIDLKKLEGWDPFNVTEDADLGIRLFKKGYKTAIIESVTLEEANSRVGNWIRQRSRWIKGYMQTYLVHTRELFGFKRFKGTHSFIFHLVIGGKIAFILINPLLWITTISYFALYRFVGPAIHALYPPVVFYMAVISLALGNFMFVYYYMVGCVKREQWHLIKFALLIPFYWILISIAGFISLYQLIFKPHYWEKTVHGLHLKLQKKIKQAVVETEEMQAGVQFPKWFKVQLGSRMSRKSHYFGGSFLILSLIVANGLNLFFNLYIGRSLGLTDLALVSLINSLLYLSTIPTNALTSAVNYRTGYLFGKYGEQTTRLFWRKIRTYTVSFAVVISALWLIVSPFLKEYFNAETIIPFWFFIIIWLVSFPAAVDRGYLSGKLLFGAMAFVTIFEPTVKFLLTVLFVKLHIQSLVYTTIPLSTFLVFFVSWVLARIGLKSAKTEEVPARFPHKYFFASMFSGLSNMTFLSLDIVLANHYLPPIDAGIYSLISLVGKMIYFSGRLSTQFLVPLVSKAHGEQKDSRRIFYHILFATIGLTTIGFIGLGPIGHITVPFIFGRKALNILPYLTPFSFAMLCFTVAKVFESYYLTKKVYSFTFFSVVLAFFQYMLIANFHGNVSEIVYAMVIIGMLNLASALLLHMLSKYVKPFENNISDLFGLFSRKETEFTKSQGFRILILNWRDTKHTWAGGAEIYVQELASRLVTMGHAVTLFCGNDGQSARNQIVNGVKVVRRGGFYTVYFWSIVYYIFRFRKHVDIVIDSENGIPFFSPLYVGKPVILLVHHIHQEVFRKHLSFPFSIIAQTLEAKIMPILYRKKQIITVSESSKQELRRLGFTDEHIAVIHPGINTDEFVRKEKTKTPSLLYLGRLKPYKNIDVAVRAFALVKMAFPFSVFIIAGTGESGGKLEQLAKKLGLLESIRFLGVVSNEQKARLLSESWIVVQPSMIEGWGITVIEANASGTPVIASNVNGLRDSIKDGKTGMLVRPKDSDAFADAVKTCFKDTKLRTQLGKEAFLWAQTFSWEKSTKQLLSVIENYFTAKTQKKTQPTYVVVSNKA
jgi:cellulose synthase/poly-beta-1,6-N-acetylglucosamine synthase-like glycosyltransferase/glycosyltransferase involved in cell wall biosynthesis/O-antigen/teichoic acid export membrane protein